MKSNEVPYLICEVANSHGGNINSLFALIEAFAELDYPKKAMKFQVFAADTIALPDFDWYGVYQQLELSANKWKKIISQAANYGEVWIDVFDRYSARIIAENSTVISGLKLQASVLENDEVLDELMKLDLTEFSIILNISGFELSEIHRIIKRFRVLTDAIILQLGFQAYPTAIADTAMQKIPVLRSAFPDLVLGFADHADAASDFAELAPIYAHLMGCEYIEKHFCVERSQAAYDSYSALEPAQMQSLCTRLAQLAGALSGPFVNVAEREYLEKSVQIPVLRRKHSAGERITQAGLLFRRTAQAGITWKQLDELQRKRNVLSMDKGLHSSLTESDFRPAKVGIIVACRMKSSRLPRKAVLPIAGRPSVERCLGQCFSVAGIDEVILASSTLAEDAILADYTWGERAKFLAGDPDDVITRYIGACDKYGIDIVVRVTADCPLISYEILEKLLASHFETGADYTAAEDAAVGTAGEIISTSALRAIIKHLGRAEYSEYMTWYFRNNPDIFKLNIVQLPDELVRDYRLTLDHPEDLELFERLLTRLGSGKESYSLAEVFQVLDSDSDLVKLNHHIPLKYRTDQKLIAMLNEKTRIG